MFTHTIILHLVMTNKIDVTSDYQKHANYSEESGTHTHIYRFLMKRSGDGLVLRFTNMYNLFVLKIVFML